KSCRSSVHGGTMRRHEITDEHWNLIKDFLPGKSGDPGRTAVNNRFLSMLCFGSLEPAFLGETFGNDLGVGIRCSSGLIDGANMACGSGCWKSGKSQISNA